MGQIRSREERQERQRSDSLGAPNSIRNSKELNILPEKEDVGAITSSHEHSHKGGFHIRNPCLETNKCHK